MFNRILLALAEQELTGDLESPIFQALMSLRFYEDCQLVLGHVLPVNASELERSMDEHHECQGVILEKMENVQSALTKQLGNPSQIELATGEPGDEIVRLANIHQVDLIVLGSRGLKGVNRVLNQSVSAQVSEEAVCSVLVVKSSI